MPLSQTNKTSALLPSAKRLNPIIPLTIIDRIKLSISSSAVPCLSFDCKPFLQLLAKVLLCSGGFWDGARNRGYHRRLSHGRNTCQISLEQEGKANVPILHKQCFAWHSWGSASWLTLAKDKVVALQTRVTVNFTLCKQQGYLVFLYLSTKLYSLVAGEYLWPELLLE